MLGFEMLLLQCQSSVKSSLDLVSDNDLAVI